jgi:hypothetical protein
MPLAGVLINDLYKTSRIGFVISEVFCEASVLFNVWMKDKL